MVEKFSDIANFIAFQDGFDMLFRILSKESGVTARDCLKVVYSIVHGNIVTLKLLSQRMINPYVIWAIVQYIQTLVHFVNISLLYSTTIKESEIIDLSIYPSIISRSSAQVENSRRSSSAPTETPFMMSVDILDYSIRVRLFEWLFLSESECGIHVQLLEELTDLAVLPEVQAVDPSVVMIIKNNTKLVGKVWLVYRRVYLKLYFSCIKY